ncbi:MAG: tetratricopeptide repeat protein [Elusimicrobia bacterium]|nr:tetratricopeptide repeat protein [Elusimicrobiota bacterium]
MFWFFVVFPSKTLAAETAIEPVKNSMFHYLLYENYFREGKYLDGLNELEKAIELDKNSVFLKEEILPIYFDMGDYDKTLKVAGELLKKTGGNFKAYYYTASVWEIRENLSKAMEFYKKALDKKPSSGDANFALGRVYMKEKDFENAYKYFEKAVENEPDNPVMRLTLALLYESQKKWEKALEQYKKIRRMDPNSVNSLLKIGEIYLKMGKDDLAEKEFEKALEEEPDNFSAALSLAGIYEKRKDWEKVKEVLMKIHNVRDDYPEIEIYLGLANLNLGDSEKAEEFFKRAVSVAPENSAVYYSLALIYIDTGSYSRALDELDKCEEKGGGSSDVSFLKGVCFDSLGDKESAFAEFEEAISQDSRNHRALNYLGYSLAESGKNLKKAKAYIDRALKMEPENGAYLDTAGWVQFKMGNYKTALKYLRKASKKMSDPVIWEHLGDCWLKLRNRSEARKAYRKAIETGADRKKIERKIKHIK